MKLFYVSIVFSLFFIHSASASKMTAIQLSNNPHTHRELTERNAAIVLSHDRKPSPPLRIINLEQPEEECPGEDHVVFISHENLIQITQGKQLFEHTLCQVVANAEMDVRLLSHAVNSHTQVTVDDSNQVSLEGCAPPFDDPSLGDCEWSFVFPPVDGKELLKIEDEEANLLLPRNGIQNQHRSQLHALERSHARMRELLTGVKISLAMQNWKLLTPYVEHYKNREEEVESIIYVLDLFEERHSRRTERLHRRRQ